MLEHVFVALWVRPIVAHCVQQSDCGHTGKMPYLQCSGCRPCIRDNGGCIHCYMPHLSRRCFPSRDEQCSASASDVEDAAAPPDFCPRPVGKHRRRVRAYMQHRSTLISLALMGTARARRRRRIVRLCLFRLSSAPVFLSLVTPTALLLLLSLTRSARSFTGPKRGGREPYTLTAASFSLVCAPSLSLACASELTLRSFMATATPLTHCPSFSAQYIPTYLSVSLCYSVF